LPENEEENIENNISDSSSVSEDDDIPSAGNDINQRGQSQGRRRGCGRGCGRGRGRSQISQNNEIDDLNQVELLPLANNLEVILKKVRAAIYLSLDLLWDIPSEISLVATMLDPRMKSFLFVEDLYRREQKAQAESLLSNLYTQLKQDLELPEEIR